MNNRMGRLLSPIAPASIASPIQTVLCLGQSNMAGYYADAVKGGAAVPAGVTVDFNGSRLVNWPSICGPTPYMVDALIAAGSVAANLYVCVRAVSGEAISTVISTRLVSAYSDLTAASKTPDVCWLWHGESAANTTEADATDYEEQVVRLAALIRARYPDCHFYQQELLTTLVGTYPYYLTVKESQVAAQNRMRGSGIVSSHTPSTLSTHGDGVHTLAAGAQEAAERAVAMW